MFERYTNSARRSIFFARYEASVFGSAYIETQHLLLGLLREDRPLRDLLPAGAPEQIRKRIQEGVLKPAQPIATSVDLPLSIDSKRALTYAASEMEALNHPVIDCWHLALGLLRVETSMAATLLRDLRIEYAGLRASPPESLRPAPPGAHLGAGPLAPAAGSLQHLLMNTIANLEERAVRRTRPSPWTRKKALGHLIDWAITHQQWFARALTETKLVADGYPKYSWLSVQDYEDVAWPDLIKLCCALNGLISHVISRIPEHKLNTPCSIGNAEPIPLRELVSRYVGHCEEILGQLLTRE